jgi:hypothetical protein
MAFRFKTKTENDELLKGIDYVLSEYNKNVDRLNSSVKKGINKVEYPKIKLEISKSDVTKVDLSVYFPEGTNSYKDDIHLSPNFPDR